MEYRSVGSTGLRISEIGFGCGDTAGILVRAEPVVRRRAVERAIELGVNYFDTAPSYGRGLSETNLGLVLRELGVRPVVTTKVDIMPDQLDHVANAVVANTEASLKRLNLDYVDILEIHNAPTNVREPAGIHGFERLSVDDYLRPNGALEGLERVRRQGKTRFLGFTAPSADYAAMARLIDEGSFSMVNITYNLLNPSAGVAVPHGLEVARDYQQIIDRAQASGVGVAIISPLGAGVLNDQAISGGARHPVGGGPAYDDDSRYRADLAKAARFGFLSRPGTRSLAQTAVRFILMHPGVTTVLGGYSEVAHLEEFVCCSSAADLSAVDLARIEMIWRANFAQPGAAAADVAHRLLANF
jgi:L-glyceraldehyde 3-phosphate reductase